MLWTRFDRAGEDQTDLPTLREIDALMSEDVKVAAAESAATAVTAVDVDVLSDVDEDGKWKFKGAASLKKAKFVVVKRKVSNLQETSCAKRPNIPTSVADAYTLDNGLLGRGDVYASTAERVTPLDRGSESEIGLVSMAIKRDENCKALTVAQMKEIREVHPRKLDMMTNFF